MRLIPSISPQASVSGQGKQGMTPSGAHQCSSASSSLQAGGGGWFEAGAIQHRESPRSIYPLYKLLSLVPIAVDTARGLQGTVSLGLGPGFLMLPV